MKNLLKFSLVALGVMASVNAHAFTADAKTTTSAGNATLVDRFWQDASFTVRQPTDSVVWFVADTAKNGVNLTPTSAGNILGPDDVLLVDSRVGTGISTVPAGNKPGKINLTGLSISDVYTNANIYAYVWNVALPAASTFTPVDGNTFGVFNIGDPIEPEVGSASWFVSGNVWSGQYIVGVPEPSTYVLGGLGLLSILGFRRFRK